MKNLETLVAMQQAQIQALKKRAAGQTLDKTDALIIELTLVGRQAPVAQEKTKMLSNADYIIANDLVI